MVPKDNSSPAPVEAGQELSALVVPLLKGVLYLEDNPA